MKTIFKAIILGGIFVFIAFGCEKEETNLIEFHVIVKGKGMDCGDLFVIEFSDHFDELYQVTGREGWQMCYAYGLEEKFKVQGKELLVKIRKPKKDELRFCTCMGPGYPWVTIVSAKEIANE